ncbi:hypothetical protein DS745_06140 [Anaerobacillus alkaliphilus]|uniref:ATPase BadF/BadG/BcrA/BcrD type domain-containing protein n=1 Tax=Anaerobacillus alkaliphilus TaxID=1548597 RepID=A0A4Q0VXR7_9BACI|nr:BadF/BadG/BcrA/BcrD ATPase family protein [Anaerobacillus alkaliphilus]RXJ02548.1 hypothetical protein DS745_06140 [Anaerobacillus alkaliphilus]
MYVLGIDGGGTKTTAAICDIEGNIQALTTVGPTNPNNPDAKVQDEFDQLVSNLRDINDCALTNVSVIFAGMSGVNRSEDKLRVKQAIFKALNREVTFFSDNDAVNALYSGTLGEPGIVHIAGTGSITFGINHENQRSRVGGWGYLIGDEGSGYDIGKKAIQAVFAAYDQTGPQTSLTDLILEHAMVLEPPDLISEIYEPGKAKSLIAPISKLVFKAADVGDEVAQKIILDAARSTAESTYYLYMKLFQRQQGLIPLILAGGVYKRADWFLPTLEQVMNEKKLPISIVVPKVVPAAGALVAGFKLSGKTVPTVFLEKCMNNGLKQK